MSAAPNHETDSVSARFAYGLAGALVVGLGLWGLLALLLL